MKRILVLVKQVPTTESVRLDEETGTMIRAGADAAMNPLDLHAVEAAVRLAESAPDPVEILVLSMGPPQAQSAVREALAMGCDRGILLTGPELAGADTWATAYALVKCLRTLGPIDLVLCGERATDGETGQVGPMVAALWDVPLLTYVSGLTREGETLRADRAIEGGTERVSCPLPAVVCVLRDLNEPRLPTLSGKLTAHTRELAILNGEAIGADPSLLGLKGSPTRVMKVITPSFRRAVTLVDAAQVGIDAVVDHLEASLVQPPSSAEGVT